jgi:hypothetical protein
VVFEIRLAKVISLLPVHFPMKISGNSEILLMNRDNQVVGNFALFENLLAFWTTVVRIRNILCSKAASKWVFFCRKYLVKFYLVSGRFLRVRP